MGMPAFYVTALTALVLAYGDIQDWSMLAILGVVFVAGAAIAYSAKKYSYWATLSVVVTLIIADAIGRSMSSTPSELHASVGLADLGYSAFLVACVGWVGGYMMRSGEIEPKKAPAPYMEAEPISTRTSPFAAPNRRQRRTA